MESYSTLGESNSREGFVDRLSGLPVDIALHLLTFLDVADLVSLMLLSKRLHTLCMSVPILSVDNWEHIASHNQKIRYERLVANFLALRQKTWTEVHELVFTWQPYMESPEDDELSRIISYCIKTIICCGTQSLYLNLISYDQPLNLISYHQPQYLPPTFFHLTQNLKELSLYTNNCSLYISPLVTFQPPMLEKLTIQHSNLNDWQIQSLVMALPSLKSLFLLCCTGIKTLTINSSSLEHLKIINNWIPDYGLDYICINNELDTVSIACPYLQKLHIEWYPSPSITPVFNILQSNELKEFIWRGLPLGSYFSSRFIRLQTAGIYLLMPPAAPIPWLLLQNSKHFLDTLFAQLSMTKSLKLHSNTIKLFHTKGCSLSPLSKVESLAIELCFLTDEEMSALAFFLRGMLDLKTLSIASWWSTSLGDRFANGCDMEYWEGQDLTCVPQLKKATVEVLRGGRNGIELVKYLLKHATALKTLNIICDPALESSILEQIMQYRNQYTRVFFTSIYEHRKSVANLWENFYFENKEYLEFDTGI